MTKNLKLEISTIVVNHLAATCGSAFVTAAMAP